MNDTEERKLARVYSSWEDASLLAALTTGRSQYRPDVVPLIEAEVAKRNLPIPPAPCATVATATQPDTGAAMALIRNLRWRRMTWVGRGYVCVFVWTFLPMVPPLVAGTVAAICGSRLDEGSVYPCVVLGCDIGGLLYAMGVMGWFMLLTFPTGVIAAVAFTIVALVRKWRDGRCREEECEQRRP
jgi:hypothetical protein